MLHLAVLSLLQGVPVFGSTYAGKPYFDQAGSDIQITQAAHCGDENPAKEGLRVTEFSEKEDKERGGWPHDSFHIQWIRAGKAEKVIDVEASYGSCDAFAIDLNGDGVPEVAVESGWGRGTSVYQRQVEFFRRTPKGFQSLFRVTLNGYVMTEEGPDGWERSWALRAVHGAFASVVLQLRIRPERRIDPDGEALDALQFSQREYCWQPAALAYRLCRFEFTKWEK